MGIIQREPLNVARWADGRDNIPHWSPLVSEDVAKCLEKEASADALEEFFPGPCFFGRLVGSGEPEDKQLAISVLRSTLGMHERLRGRSDLITQPDDRALALAEEIEALVADEGAIGLARGEGYDEDDGTLRSPMCHIYHCELRLTETYASWLIPRYETLNALGNVMLAQEVYFLKLSHKMRLEDDNRKLLIDIYGNQSLLSDWDKWLQQYEDSLPEDIVLSGLELVAGLLHLADTLASLHLASAVPHVTYGGFECSSADDSLTDIWFMCYDKSEENGLVIGSCEVCGNLFVSTNKQMKGHPGCMNRRRVARSRAKQYALRVENGVAPRDAAKASSISIKAARETLEFDGYPFKEDIDYWGV